MTITFYNDYHQTEYEYNGPVPFGKQMAKPSFMGQVNAKLCDRPESGLSCPHCEGVTRVTVDGTEYTYDEFIDLIYK